MIAPTAMEPDRVSLPKRAIRKVSAHHKAMNVSLLPMKIASFRKTATSKDRAPSAMDNVSPPATVTANLHKSAISKERAPLWTDNVLPPPMQTVSSLICVSGKDSVHL